MKKKISMMMLLMKHIIPKFILLIFAGAIVQISVFSMVMKREYQSFELVIESAYIPLIFAILFLVMCFLLDRFYKKRMEGYGFQVLRMSEREKFIVKFVFNILLMILFFFIEIIIVFILSEIYFYYMPERFLSPQSLYVAMVSNTFLYILIPGNGLLIEAGKILVAIGISGLMAIEPKTDEKNKRKKIHPVILFNLLIIPGTLSLIISGDAGYSMATNLMCIVISVVMSMTYCYNMFRSEEDSEKAGEER